MKEIQKLPLRLFIALLALTFVFASGDKNKKNGVRSKTTVTDGLLEVNNVKAFLSNKGSLFRKGGDSGFITPHPDFASNAVDAATVYASGLWVAGKLNGEVKSAAAIYSYDYVPGTLQGVDAEGKGIYNDPESSEYKIYYYASPSHMDYLNGLLGAEDNTPGAVIHAYANRVLAKIASEEEWAIAVSQGAPLVPPGDVAAFSVYHDADETTRDGAANGTSRMNIEVRQLVWAYRTSGPVNNAVFVKFDFVNRNASPIEDMYASVWSDPDLGEFSDDLVGSSKALGLGYCYNGSDNDATYTGLLGLAPPALGYDYFQGVAVPDTGTLVRRSNPELYSHIENGDSVNFSVLINKDASYVALAGDEEIPSFKVEPASSFVYYNNNNDSDGNPQTGDEIYNYMRVLNRDGNQFQTQADAITAGLTTAEDAAFFFNGDPTVPSGWNDAGPDDRRFLQNNGPFTLAPYSDTNGNGVADFGDDGFNSVVVGIFSSFGTSALNSVSNLFVDDAAIQRVFDGAFAVTPPPPAPEVANTETSKSVSLTWKEGSTSFQGKTVTTEKYGLDAYEFEAYQVVQYPSSGFLEAEMKVLAEYDLINGVTFATNAVSDPITGQNYEEVVKTFQETGLRRTFEFNEDAFTTSDVKTLVNGKKYYIGIRGIAYAGTRESGFTSQIRYGAFTNITVVPNTPQLGTAYTASYGDSVATVFSNPDNTEAQIFANVVDPGAVTGNSYSVEIIHEGTSTADPTTWGVIVSSVASKKRSKSAVGDTLGTAKVTSIFDVKAGKISLSDPTNVNSIVTEGISFTFVAAPPEEIPIGIDKVETDAAFDAWESFDPNHFFGTFTGGNGTLAQIANDFFGWATLSYNGTTYTSSDITLSDMKVVEFRFGAANSSDIIIWDRRNDMGLNPNQSVGGGNKFVYVGLENVPMSAWDITDSANPRQLTISNRSSGGGPWDVDYAFSYTWVHNVDYTNVEANLPAIWTDGTRTSADESNWFFSYKQIFWLQPATQGGGAASMAGTMTVTPFLYQPTTASAVVTAPAAPKLEDPALAKASIENVGVYPNPYYGGHSQETAVNKFMKFIHLSDKATINIYNLNGILVKTIEKNDNSQEAQWGFTNNQGVTVASGLYFAVVDMPNIGKKVIKLGVFLSQNILPTF